MPPSTEQVEAARALLRETCELLGEHRDEAVLVGGWVPDVLFPDAGPPHVGSIDVDLALRLNRLGYERLVTILRNRGFQQGVSGYEFYRSISIAEGRAIRVHLDLLTSEQLDAREFAGLAPRDKPQPVSGAEIAFRDNQLIVVGAGQLRVAGILAFLVMKSLAMHARHNEKDAYDIHFCLENYPGQIEALALLFHPWRGDPLVEEALAKMAAKFRDEHDDGPRIVADMDRLFDPERRDIRKAQAALRVQEFLRLAARPAS
ncbi:MAG: hypothetical protein ABI273_04575 [Lacunisphaera sp.]